MTATNHMLAGAVVAVSVQHPLLIAPLAIASHFVLDVLPHFGIHKNDVLKRNKHPLFQYIVAVDIALALTLLVLLPSILAAVVTRWVLLLGMMLAFAPDLVWVRRFILDLRKKKDSYEPSWLTRFHHKIQWGERSWGVVIEIGFFGAMGVWLGFLAA